MSNQQPVSSLGFEAVMLEVSVDERTAKILYKILNRRTQKNKYSYQEYYDKIQKKIIRPKIYTNIVEMGYAM